MGAANLEPEVQQAVEATAALLEEMGHTLIEIPTPYDLNEYYKGFAGRSKFSADSLEHEVRALGRPIDSSTLEPLSLKLYEFGRTAQSASLGDKFEAWRITRFRVGEAIDPFDILLTPTMRVVAPPNDSIYCAPQARPSP
ncbi:amidase family protein [Bradyrhizobium sp. 157]|uniref:amidase family protein n=1 Tax=Bradyrhizobium sp. 157 TaxID=2782631 RepID=UPI001FFC2319|nr:amidase family protein [Bradyrhizobium sp. 157]